MKVYKSHSNCVISKSEHLAFLLILIQILRYKHIFYLSFFNLTYKNLFTIVTMIANPSVSLISALHS